MRCVDASVQSLLDACAQRAAQPVIRDVSGTFTGAQLLEAAESWQQRLDALSAKRVAVRAGNSLQWVALDLAMLAGGFVAVPIPGFFSAPQVTHVLERAGIDMWIADDPEVPAGFASASGHAGLQIARRHLQAPPALHRGAAKITFTSGSTGTPKGVCLSAQQMLTTARSLFEALAELAVESHLSVLPYALLLENLAGVYANLYNGSLVTALPLADIGVGGASGLDVQAFVSAFAVQRPESTILVPQQLLALTAAAEFGLDRPESLRFAAVGGGKVAPDLIHRARKQRIPVYEGYGLSECGSVLTLNRPDADRPGTVGRVLPHAEVRIDAQGEVLVRGAGMLGYLGEPAADGGWLATGDLGGFDEDGYLSVTGRRRNCFITSFGRNVQPEWVESELLAEIAVAQAAVLGEASPINVALLVVRDDAEAVQAAIAAANARLPDYARVHTWRAVDAARFASCLTANGRLKRDVVADVFSRELAELLQIEEIA